jgi:hypothetical protein
MTFLRHLNAQVRGPVQGRVVRRRVAQFLAGFWQGPCPAIYGTSTGAIILAAALKPLLTGITSTNA